MCNHPYTVSPSRFTQFRGRIPVMAVADFNAIIALLTKWLPLPFAVDP